MLLLSKIIDYEIRDTSIKGKAVSSEDLGSNSFEEFLRYELPAQLRQELAIEIQRNMDLPLEEELRGRLPEIIQLVQQRLYQVYTENRVFDRPNQDTSRVSENLNTPSDDFGDFTLPSISHDEAGSTWNTPFDPDFSTDLNEFNFPTFGHSRDSSGSSFQMVIHPIPGSPSTPSSKSEVRSITSQRFVLPAYRQFIQATHEVAQTVSFSAPGPSADAKGTS